MDKQLKIMIEHEIEQTLLTLMALEIDENMNEMNILLSKLLVTLQQYGFINLQLDVLVAIPTQLPETKNLLETLFDLKNGFDKRPKLITHRRILKIWLRKNKQFRTSFLPTTF